MAVSIFKHKIGKAAFPRSLSAPPAPGPADVRLVQQLHLDSHGLVCRSPESPPGPSGSGARQVNEMELWWGWHPCTL